MGVLTGLTASNGRICLLAGLALMGALLPAGPAAAQAGHPTRAPVIACVDARAAYALNARGRAARPARWRANVKKRGRCYVIQPGDHWERILHVGGLVLMRRTPPEPGVPPLYFRADALPGPTTRDLESTLASRRKAARAPPPAARTVTPHAGQDAGDIRMEALPPAGSAAITSRVMPPPVPPPRTIASPGTGPATPGPVTPSSVTPPIVTPAIAAPVVADRGLPGSTSGYALGFGIVILLIALLAAAGLLLLRVVLRRSRRRPGAGFNEEPPPQRPVPPPRPSPALQSVRQARPRPTTTAVSPAILQPAGAQGTRDAWPREDDQPYPTDASLAAMRHRYAALLRAAGWDAASRPSSGDGHADVVARRRGRIMALQCLPDGTIVDEEAVEGACVVREREQADMSVIVTNGAFTPGARRLAVQTGIDLLHEDELAAFAR